MLYIIKFDDVSLDPGNFCNFLYLAARSLASILQVNSFIRLENLKNRDYSIFSLCLEYRLKGILAKI